MAFTGLISRERSRSRARNGGGLIDPYAGATWRVAEPNARFYNAALATTDTRLKYCFRLPYYIAQDCYVVRANMANWFKSISGFTALETDIGNAFTVEGMSIEAPNGNVATIQWNGSNGRTLSSGENDVNSDPIFPLSGYTKFTRGEKYWLKGVVSVTTSGHSFPRSSSRVSTGITGAQWARYDPAVTTLSNIYASGVFTVTGTALTNVGEGPSPMLMGVPVTDMPSVMIVGDSIRWGSDDTTQNEYGFGGYTKAASNGGTNPIPCLNMARSTQGSDAYALPKWQAYLKYCNYLLDGYGVNDFLASRTFANFTANLEAAYTLVRAAPYNYRGIIRDDLYPYTTASTDSYATEANQTKSATYASTWYPSFVSWKNTAVGNGTIDHFIDQSAIRGVDTDKWIVTGAANYATDDGVHPSNAFHNGNIQTQVRAIYDVLT